MEQYKFDLYQKEKGKPLTGVRVLSIDEVKVKTEDVFKLIGARPNHQEFFGQFTSILKYKDFEEEFIASINSVFDQFGLNKNGETFLFWNQNSIDSLSTTDLMENWDYIWFGTGDDAVIIFQPEGKLLLLTHYGRIYYKA